MFEFVLDTLGHKSRLDGLFSEKHDRLVFVLTCLEISGQLNMMQNNTTQSVNHLECYYAFSTTDIRGFSIPLCVKVIVLLTVTS